MRLSSSRATALAHRPQQDFPLWDKAGTRPSLDLQFADRKDLVDATTGSKLVDHTRASSGTYVGSDGLIKTATTNLLTYSEDISQWLSPVNATATIDAATAPDSQTTADQLLETNANGLHAISDPGIAFVAGTTYTYSIFVKPIGDRNFEIGFPAVVFTARFARFTLTGSGSVQGTDVNVTATIQPYSNGWYRCTATSTCASSSSSRVTSFINDSSNTRTYLGDTSKGVYLWGAQLEQSSTVGEYVKTTSTINSAPRFNHDPTTGESLGLLVEESRTNLLTYSEEFDSAQWVKVRGSITANATTAPDGTATADKFVEDTSTNTHIFQLQGLTGVTAGTTYTYSWFFKAAGRVDFRVAFGPDNGVFVGETLDLNLTTGALTNVSGFSSTPLVTSLPDGWWRLQATVTAAASATPVIRGTPLVGGTSVYTGDGTSGIYLWGAQLEAGSFPTSYIPTTTAAVTRAADVASISGSNFSSWYRQDEGTVFTTSTFIGDNGLNQFLYSISDGAFGDEIRTFKTSGTSSCSYGVESSASGTTYNVFLDNLSAFGTEFSSVFAFAENNTNRAVSGTLGTTDTSVDIPTVSQIRIGARMNSTFFSNVTIKRLTYWPTRLPNEVLQTITQ